MEYEALKLVLCLRLSPCRQKKITYYALVTLFQNRPFGLVTKKPVHFDLLFRTLTSLKILALAIAIVVFFASLLHKITSSTLYTLFILLPNENPSFYLFLFAFSVVKIKNRSYGYASPSLRLAHSFRCVVPRQRKK